MNVSDRLTLLRNAKKLLRKDVAEQLGIPYSTYCHYENGSMELKVSALIKLVEFYNVSADWILGENSPKNAPPNEEDEKEIFKALESMSNEELDEIHSYCVFLKWKLENKL